LQETLVNNDYEEYVIVADCVKMTPNKLKINRNFLIYSINSKNVRTGAELVSTGTTRIRINLTELKKLWIPYPPIKEQTAIANFLDHEARRIDALVEEKNRFIELLKEKRQALISHAIAKGLDPTIKMKESGIEWLGRVPEHWKVKRLKFINYINPSKSEINSLDKDLDVQFLPMELVNEDGTYLLSEIRKLSEVYSGYTYCRNDDVILAKITPCFENGKGTLLSGLINGIAFGSTEFHVLRPSKSYPKFVFYITKTTPFRKLGEMEMKGSVGQQRIPDSFVKNFNVAEPPFNEQIAITNFLDRETANIDALITGTQTSIALLKEHRTALISAAVTGKIDVREAA
jgi:type I restriction enzyme, S subunit